MLIASFSRRATLLWFFFLSFMSFSQFGWWNMSRNLEGNHFLIDISPERRWFSYIYSEHDLQLSRFGESGQKFGESGCFNLYLSSKTPKSVLIFQFRCKSSANRCNLFEEFNGMIKITKGQKATGHNTNDICMPATELLILVGNFFQLIGSGNDEAISGSEEIIDNGWIKAEKLIRNHESGSNKNDNYSDNKSDIQVERNNWTSIFWSLMKQLTIGQNFFWATISCLCISLHQLYARTLNNWKWIVVKKKEFLSRTKQANCVQISIKIRKNLWISWPNV